MIIQFAAAGGQSLIKDPNFKIISYKASVHRELSMRNDQAPFTDCLARPQRPRGDDRHPDTTRRWRAAYVW